MTRSVPLSQFLSPAAQPPKAAAAQQPALGALDIDAADLSGLRYDAPPGFLVRELRGVKMRTTAGVFDEFAAAFQFPYYFGENKDAFDECLRDLGEFLGDAAGYVAVVRDSSELLAEQPRERAWFTEAIADCADYWARRGISFRVVLQGPVPTAPASVAPQVIPLSLD
ncbi:barstar family protein [Nocardia sp. XZ_19_385]|uniref:barstar family protein n=1 Tax=Nocardia sp. XZ_19_385 TaxID=2769488 RepID=UPI00188FF6EB|nr:barstar family protein [Nocardia sp. XZ_19_385]